MSRGALPITHSCDIGSRCHVYTTTACVDLAFFNLHTDTNLYVLGQQGRPHLGCEWSAYRSQKFVAIIAMCH